MTRSWKVSDDQITDLNFAWKQQIRTQRGSVLIPPPSAASAAAGAPKLRKMAYSGITVADRDPSMTLPAVSSKDVGLSAVGGSSEIRVVFRTQLGDEFTLRLASNTKVKDVKVKLVEIFGLEKFRLFCNSCPVKMSSELATINDYNISHGSIVHVWIERRFRDNFFLASYQNLRQRRAHSVNLTAAIRSAAGAGRWIHEHRPGLFDPKGALSRSLLAGNEIDVDRRILFDGGHNDVIGAIRKGFYMSES